MLKWLAVGALVAAPMWGGCDSDAGFWGDYVRGRADHEYNPADVNACGHETLYRRGLQYPIQAFVNLVREFYPSLVRHYRSKRRSRTPHL